MLPIHDCIQTSLENDYFKQKLTEFYKENKFLKEQINQLKNLPSKEYNDAYRREISTQTIGACEAVWGGQIGSTTCSVCCDRINTSQKASNTRVLKSSKENNSKKQPQAVDNDEFNKRNKVFIYKYYIY